MNCVSLPRVVRSEWIKLITLRSTILAYAAIACLLVVVAGIALTLPGVDADDDTGDALLTLLVLVELVVGVTGVVAATGEYAAGTIRSTFAAVPRRVPVLVAKLLVHGGVVLALAVPAAAVGAVAGSVVAPEAIGSPLDGEVLRALGGTALVFSVVSVLGVASGMLVRSSPVAIGILFAMVFLPVMVTVAPEVTAFVPGRAAQAVVIADPPPEAALLGPGAAVAVLLAWVAAAAGAAAILLCRRDA